MFYEAEFWVAVGFVLFVLAMVRVGAHRSALGALDDRRARVQAELDEARRLRDGGASAARRIPTASA